MNTEVQTTSPAQKPDAWLEERKTGIGGDDAAALCGEHEFKTAYQVALEKKGLLLPDESLAENDSVIFGVLLEDSVAGEWARRNNEKIYRKNDMIRSKKHPHMVAHLDRGIYNKKRRLEVKTSGDMREWGKTGTDEVPARVVIQCQHYMAVEPDIEAIEVAALLFAHGRREFRDYTIYPNASLITNIIEIEDDFWKLIQGGGMPEPDWEHRSTVDLIHRLRDGVIDDKKEVIVNVDNILQWTANLREAADKRLVYEKLEENIKAHILFAMGQGTVAPAGGFGNWVYRTVKKKAYSVEESTYNELRLVKAKAGKEVKT